MKFGINIINFGPLTSPESLRHDAQWSEQVGFHLAMVSDHVAVTPDVAGLYPAPFYEPFTTLAWLAGITTRIELGATVVILPYRHPLLIARMAANLDQFSGGRLVLGVGVGWARAEFDALGVPFERRGRLSDDYLQAVLAHWTQERASLQNASVRFHEVHTGPLPVRRPHPPIWVGGNSTAAIHRAARYGDAWHPLNAPLDWLAGTGLPLLRRASAEEQRAVPVFAPRIRIRLTDAPLADPNRPAGQGSLDQVRRDLETLEAMGAEWLVLDTYHGRPEDLANSEIARREVEVLLEKAIDLRGQRLVS